MPYFTNLLKLICFYLLLDNSKALIYDSTGGQFCPLYDSHEWRESKRKLNCSPLSNYHCAKDHTEKWREVCDRPTNCKKGEEPQVTRDDRILCVLCADAERYNPNTNTPSNEFSECPVRKTRCDKEKNGRIECVPAYDTSVSDASHKQERRCRCDYENGYKPEFYQDSDTFTCREAQELTCNILYPPCPDGQKLQDDYRCHNIPTTPKLTLQNFTGSDSSYAEVKTKLAEKETSSPSRTTKYPKTTIERTTGKTTGESGKTEAPTGVETKAVIAVAASVCAFAVMVFLVLLAVWFIVRWGRKRKKKRKKKCDDAEHERSSTQQGADNAKVPTIQNIYNIDGHYIDAAKIGTLKLPNNRNGSDEDLDDEVEISEDDTKAKYFKKRHKEKGTPEEKRPFDCECSSLNDDQSMDNIETSLNASGNAHHMTGPVKNKGTAVVYETMSGQITQIGKQPHDPEKQQFLLTHDNLCADPKQLQRVLAESFKQHQKEKKEMDAVKSRLEKNCVAVGLRFRGVTPGDGNCFFEAVSSQLQRLGLEAKSPTYLRQQVVKFLERNRSFEVDGQQVHIDNFVLGSFEAWCSEMKKDGTFADHVAALGMGRMLEIDILIVTSSPANGPTNNFTWIVGRENFSGSPVLLGHFWEYHYQSLEPSGVSDTVPQPEADLSIKAATNHAYKTLQPGPIIQNISYDLSTHKILKPTSPDVAGIYKKVMNKTIIILKETLAASTIDFIVRSEIGTAAQRMNINDENKTYMKNGLMVDLINSHGFEAYKKFKEILQESNQISLLNELEKSEYELLKEESSKESGNNEQEMGIIEGNEMGKQDEKEEVEEDEVEEHEDYRNTDRDDAHTNNNDEHIVQMNDESVS